MRYQQGNALLYILIAVGLMAAITYAISRDNSGQQADRMDGARVDLMATQMIEHVASAQQVVHHMTQWGADYAEMTFDLPGSADYDTEPSKQIYHPRGGGLQPMQLNSDMFEGGGTRGWKWQNQTNVEWSTSEATDLIYSFIDLPATVCAKINERLHDDATIPSTTVNFNDVLVNDSTNSDFAVDDCADCENVSSLCVKTGTAHAFYTIIGSR